MLCSYIHIGSNIFTLGLTCNSNINICQSDIISPSDCSVYSLQLRSYRTTQVMNTLFDEVSYIYIYIYIYTHNYNKHNNNCNNKRIHDNTNDNVYIYIYIHNYNKHNNTYNNERIHNTNNTNDDMFTYIYIYI